MTRMMQVYSRLTDVTDGDSAGESKKCSRSVIFFSAERSVGADLLWQAGSDSVNKLLQFRCAPANCRRNQHGSVVRVGR